MRRKIRELKAQIARFCLFSKKRKRKSSVLATSFTKKNLTISGKDGDDVLLYLEKQLNKLLTELEKIKA